MSASQPKGRVTGGLRVVFLLLGRVGMGLLVNQHFVAGVVLLVLVAGSLFVALREGDE